MKITAYKDPVTGLLFEDEAKLAEFQANRKREETAEKRRREAREAAEVNRQTLCRELSSKEQFVDLARKMYDFVLKTSKLKRNKTPLHVEDIRITRWNVSSSLRLTIDIEVTLSGNPDATYADVFVRMSPVDVLYPFTLSGCGGTDVRGKKLTYSYGMATELESLPKLLSNMRKAAKLMAAEDAHLKDVAAKVSDLKAHDIALAELDQEVEAARKVLEAAQEAFGLAAGKRNRRAQTIADDAAKQMPFKQAKQLAELKTAAGLPEGSDDRWQVLAVRNALLKPETAQA